jgi:excisionase family DNA binding protein
VGDPDLFALIRESVFLPIGAAAERGRVRKEHKRYPLGLTIVEVKIMKKLKQINESFANVAPFLTIQEVATLLRCSNRTIARMLAQGRLRGSKITRSSGTAGRRLILRSELEQLVSAGIDD